MINFTESVKLINMAHERKRHLKPIIHKTLGFSPVVGIIGHRQVGKTTLVAPFSSQYITLDDLDMRKLANEDPKKFLRQQTQKLLVIDECQKAPPIFDAIKEQVRKNPKPGQLLLTGSVRFTSKKIIRESLTGRIINLELLPLTISELADRPLCQLSSRILSQEFVKAIPKWLSVNAQPRCPLKMVHLYEKAGGLPGICFIRDEKLRELRMNEYFSTILDRDLREVCQTNIPYLQIYDLLKTLAQNQGEPINYSEMRRQTQISPPTLKKILAALESVFLIRLIKIEGGQQGFICYLEDHFESKILAHSALSAEQYFTQLIYRNVRAEFYYSLGNSFRTFHYLTKHNTTIPFAIQTKQGNLGYLPLAKPTPSHGELMAAQSFIRNYKNAKVVLLHREAELEPINANTLLLSDRYFY